MEASVSYDRWGNRTINTRVTYGVGINNKAFNVNRTNNRLEVPGGQSGAMTYDSVGNLNNDTYTGAGNRKASSFTSGVRNLAMLGTNVIWALLTLTAWAPASAQKKE